MIDEIINYTILNFNFGIIISINVLAYIIIQGLNYFTKNALDKGYKILITIACSIALFLLYGHISDIETDVLVNSTIIAPVTWDWIIKPLFKKFNIDYKEK